MNKIYITFPILLFIFISCSCSINSFFGKPESVFKYGYFDKTGTEIIPAVYDGAKEFSEDLAPVKSGELWGYVDRNGNMVIKPQFYDANIFSEGKAAVKTDSGYMGKNWCYIDKKGNIVIASKFYSAGRFSKGVARVTTDFTKKSGFSNHQHGYINKEGTVILSDPGRTTYREDFHFYSEGRFPAAGDSGQFGFMDESGNMVIKDQFETVHSFSDGVAAVAIKITSPDMLKGLPILDKFSGDKEKQLWGYIDINGNWIVKPTLTYAEDFKEGIALANTMRLSKFAPNGHIFFNSKGQNVFGKIFYGADTFSEGAACITTDDIITYYIGKNGEKNLIPQNSIKLIGGGVFSDGAAYVSFQEKDV